MAVPELRDVITEIRAILQSAPTEGLLTRQLLNDYKDIVGSKLPFRELGYDSVDDLIQKSGEFMQKRTHEGIKIIQKESADSAHINRLVRGQNDSRKKRKPAVAQRPVRSPTASNQQHRFRGSAYTDMCSQMPNRSVKKAVASSTAIPSLMSLQIEPPVRSNRPYGQMSQQSTQNETGTTASPSQFARKNTNQDMRPITKQSNVDNAKFNYNSNRVDPPGPATVQTNGQSGNRILNRINANQNNNQTASMYSVAPQVIAPRAMPMGPVSPNDSCSNGSASTRSKGRLSERLASKKSLIDGTGAISSESDVVDFIAAPVAHQRPEVVNSVSIRGLVPFTASPLNTCVYSTSLSQFQNTKNIPFDELELMIPTEALSKFCDMKGYPSPTYKCFRTQKTHMVQCRVMVNKVIFSTYPTEFETELDARIEAARAAFEEMKKTELAAKFEVCTDTMMELAFKIRDCIPSSRGVFQKKIPDLFQ